MGGMGMSPYGEAGEGRLDSYPVFDVPSSLWRIVVPGPPVDFVRAPVVIPPVYNTPADKPKSASVQREGSARDPTVTHAWRATIGAFAIGGIQAGLQRKDTRVGKLGLAR